MRVDGAARVGILPMPSLSFEDVEVGDLGGKPMMTIDRFAVTIELMPLLRGEVRVVSMRLEEPRVWVTVNDDGVIGWQARSEASEALDPEKVVLEKFEIVNGRVEYFDQSAESEFSLKEINGIIEARSLLGPWRAEGSYVENGAAVPFKIATGRRLDNGSIRVKTDIKPPGLPVEITADGIIGADANGLFYDGTYNVAGIEPDSTSPDDPDPSSTGDVSGWRSEGKFNLTRERLEITDAVLSEGPLDRPLSVEGALTVDFGSEPQFNAKVSARQVDLDRSLGKGPGEPVEIAMATRSLVNRLADAYPPPIPGIVSFTGEGIVAGGAVIKRVSFRARPSRGGWELEAFNASLPGQATLTINGDLETKDKVSFAGDFNLEVDQPTIFATWWRGGRGDGSGRLLSPFKISGLVAAAPGQFTIENIDAFLGDAAISGRIAWDAADERQHRRMIETHLVADSVDGTQLKALAELVAGEDLVNSSRLADSFDIKLAIEMLQFEDASMRDVAVNVSFADGSLIVNEFNIGDLGGARLDITEGRIDDIHDRPRGRLEAQLDADTLVGLTQLAVRVLPDHAITKWLTGAAPSLMPAFLTASIVARPQDDDTKFYIRIGGDAAQTKLSASFDIIGELANWRKAETEAEISLVSSDVAELSRQAGILASDADMSGSADLLITAKGAPSDGMATEIKGNFAGVGVRSNGRLTIVSDLPPAFEGSLNAQSDDIEPLTQLLGLGIPGAASGNSARIAGRIESLGQAGELKLQKSEVAGHSLGGTLSLRLTDENMWRIDGDLRIDAVDFGWITALGFGSALEPIGETATAWSRESFDEPGIGRIAGRLAIRTAALKIAEGFDANSASLTLDLKPNQIIVEITGGDIVGGAISGEVSIHNVAGNVRISGRVDLQDAELEPFVWQRAGRAVASGLLDFSAGFDAAGTSPADLVSSLAGTGRIAIRGGEIRHVNPLAVKSVIRDSDLDKEFSDAELVDAIREQIDAGALGFENAEGAFLISSGAIHMNSFAVDSGTTRAAGGVMIDLTKFAIDSDWMVTFDPGDEKATGVLPQIGIDFRGPLNSPVRTYDVSRLASYLSFRQGERLLEILAQAEADRLENERLSRELRKLREDADRRLREEARAIAAQTEAEDEAGEDIRRVRKESLRAALSITSTAASRAANAAEKVTGGLSPVVPVPDGSELPPLSEFGRPPSVVPIWPAEPHVLTPLDTQLEPPMRLTPLPVQ